MPVGLQSLGKMRLCHSIYSTMLRSSTHTVGPDAYSRLDRRHLSPQCCLTGNARHRILMVVLQMGRCRAVRQNSAQENGTLLFERKMSPVRCSGHRLLSNLTNRNHPDRVGEMA